MAEIPVSLSVGVANPFDRMVLSKLGKMMPDIDMRHAFTSKIIAPVKVTTRESGKTGVIFVMLKLYYDLE